MDQSFLFEFGAVLVVAAILGVFARFFKQPLILAYLLAGIIIGPFALGLIKDTGIIETFASIGIIFLLFLVGLELNPKKLFEIGSTALLASFFQILVSGGLYLVLARASSFTTIQSIYIAIAFTFSSTAIIVTLLSNRNDLESLHGKILVGILLVQDFVAIFLLTIMSGVNTASADIAVYKFIYQIVFRAAALFITTYLVSKYVFPPIFHRIAKSQELLFLSSLAWCFFLVIVSISMGFSAEIGAFLAGVSLATLPYSSHVASKTKPLRDFFLMIFFIYLGTNLVFSSIKEQILPAILFSLLILIVNPIVVTFVISFLGYRKRTSFMTGITLTQISEFAFIIVALGNKLDILPKSVLTLTSLVAIITVLFSTYLIANSNKIYHWLRPSLGFLNSGKKKEYLYNVPDELTDHIILLGYHRMGKIILETLKGQGEQVAIIDFDPARIKELAERNEICSYGDAVDHDIVEQLNLRKAKMVISTIDKFEESEMILKTYKQNNKKIKMIMNAIDQQEAEELYAMGADFIIVPSMISGDYLSYLLQRLKKDEIKLEDLKKKEIGSIENHSQDLMVKKFSKIESTEAEI